MRFLLLLIYSGVQAVTIGVSKLQDLESNIMLNREQPKYATRHILDKRNMPIISPKLSLIFKDKINGFPQFLQSYLPDKHKHIKVINADSIINNWISRDSNIIKKLKFAPTINAVESGTGTITLYDDHTYILLGFINNMSENTSINSVSGIQSLFFIYCINLEIDYKLIDVNTQNVIFEFVSIGNSGTARIIPDSKTHVVYNTQRMVDSIFMQIANNIKTFIHKKSKRGFNQESNI
jgi:hypothetical protein